MDSFGNIEFDIIMFESTDIIITSGNPGGGPFKNEAANDFLPELDLMIGTQ